MVLHPTTENIHPTEETNARSPGLDLLFSLVRHYCDPKIILDSGNMVVKSRSYIACRLLSSLCTIPRSYGVRITACPGSRDCCLTMAGPAGVLTAEVAVEQLRGISAVVVTITDQLGESNPRTL